MYCKYISGKIGFRSNEYTCFNSWGNKDKVIHIPKNEQSAHFYSASFKKIVRKGYGGRPDETVYQH